MALGAQLRAAAFRVNDSHIICVCNLWSLNVGFDRVTSHTGHSSDGGHIPCEMMSYYLFYRVSVGFGVWVPFLAFSATDVLALR